MQGNDAFALLTEVYDPVREEAVRREMQHKRFQSALGNLCDFYQVAASKRFTTGQSNRIHDRQLGDVAPTEIGQFTTFGEFTDQNLRDLLDEVENDARSLSFGERLAKRYYLKGIRNRLLKKKGTPNPKCVALNAHLRIFPNGDVPTCQFNSHIIGNLRRQTFHEVWKSAAAAEQRSWVKRCPGCWAECEVLPSAIYTLDLVRTAVQRS